jgi:tRNA pseudouridine38-40 synthase
MLPPDIRIRESSAAPEGFHARYGACGKVYRYSFFNSRHDCAIGRQYAAHVPVQLDEKLMNEEAQALLGTHDFAAFAASGSVVKSTVRTIYRVQVKRSGDQVTLHVLGDGFLYNMVRILTGTLIDVGLGKIQPEEIPLITASCDRSRAGMTVPACGLYLNRVFY